jgi:ATPase family associated with various cellular activities (AAA)
MLNLRKQNKYVESGSAARIAAVLDAPKNSPFADISTAAAAHFELYFLAAAAHLTRRLVRIYGTSEAVFAEFPFLRIYDERLAGREPDDLADENAAVWWEENLIAWEKNANVHLPLRELREKFGLEYSSVVLLITIGLAEEDARFAAVFEALNEFSDEKRLTFGTLNEWRRDENAAVSAHLAIRRLEDLGLIKFGGTENPRSEWTVQVSAILWDVLRGEKCFGADDFVEYIESSELLPLKKLILPDALREQLKLLPHLLERGDAQTIVVRGANRNSRRTILGALARSLNLNLLEVKKPEVKDDARWKTVNTLAVLLKAMPVFRLEVAPGETVEFPAISNAVKAFGITLAKHGAVGGAVVEKSVTLTVNLPDQKERQKHWRDCLTDAETDEIAERFRLSGGNIRRAAKLAKSYSMLANREKVTLADVQSATRALNRQALDTLAIYLEPLDADWDFLAVRDETQNDLRELEARCRIRENLRNHVGRGLRGQLQAGVRALFNGTSGTGKTYAARLLAAALQKDIYRLDISTVVNKYIGETEKNLAKILAFVEELDVILLLDEGDSLLTQRTNVGSANDRYANLETNYLLQRLESFEGILIVTTNAGDRIDSAFQRRMDTVVEFVRPESAERRQIWRLHLPEKNAIADGFLEETIQRCDLTGGQIRNIALHAASLALGEEKDLNAAHLEAAVRREYRKTGAICPLRENHEADLNADRW